jgi:hypothetical protein
VALIHSTFTGKKFGFNPTADPGILRLGSKIEPSYKTKYHVGSYFGGREKQGSKHTTSVLS